MKLGGNRPPGDNPLPFSISGRGGSRNSSKGGGGGGFWGGILQGEGGGGVGSRLASAGSYICPVA